MEENKNKNVKKIIIGVGIAVATIVFVVCFAIAYNNIKSKTSNLL